MTATPPTVTALVLNYNSPVEQLRSCLASLSGLVYDGAIDIVLADNGSTQYADAPAVLGREFSAVVLQLGRNWGFAGGINRGLDACSGELVLLLNSDATVEPSMLQECVTALSRQPAGCLGVVPKIVFEHNPGVIDAVGNAINERGEAFNVGCGQIDVGQYDYEERAFGPCMAAALLRRCAFNDDWVGGLAERFFMYYEDVDWNCRANLYGYFFVTAPKAVVRHVHSASARRLGDDFKIRHIERNLLLTLVRDFDRVAAWKALASRTALLVRRVATGPGRAAALRGWAEFLLALPWAVADRRRIARRRRCSSSEFVRYATGEAFCLDVQVLGPQRRFETIAAMYERRSKTEPSAHWQEIVTEARRLACAGGETARLRDLLGGESEAVLTLLDEIERTSAIDERLADL